VTSAGSGATWFWASSAAWRQSRGQELIDRLPDVDLVLGTHKFHRVASYLDDLLSHRREKAWTWRRTKAARLP